jgi:hypothetical protein
MKLLYKLTKPLFSVVTRKTEYTEFSIHVLYFRLPQKNAATTQ